MYHMIIQKCTGSATLIEVPLYLFCLYYNPIYYNDAITNILYVPISPKFDWPCPIQQSRISDWPTSKSAVGID